MVTDLILGTAGHIDHGKTALVRALTGVDTDRLPEEKRRGITIELGFAELMLGEYRLGIVDVPGHERFVRNMLAGATGTDLALLVIAADDSVKPQTIEHLDILRLLKLDVGVVALTKCDLVDPDWVDLVEEEVRELLDDTFLRDAPMIRTSATTGTGLEKLKEALATAAQKAATARTEDITGPFRMAIDRTFTVAGHGTVVTGSVLAGQVNIGDELVVEPGETKVRVRSLESHGHAAEQLHRGQRAAINLAGIHHGDLRRGHELSSPGHLVPSRRLSVRLNLLSSAPRPLKHRARVRIHLGTAELMARVLLLDRDQLIPGETANVQVILSQPAVTTWSQPLVIRSESPVQTIGGGQVLDTDAPGIRRREGDLIARLVDLWSDSDVERASAALYFAGWRAWFFRGSQDWCPEDLARTAGIEDTAGMRSQLIERGDLVEIDMSPTRKVRIHQEILIEIAARVEKVLGKMHEQNPLKPLMDRAKVVSRFTYLRNDALVEAVLSRMADAGRVRLTERGIALAGHGPQLSAKQWEQLDQIVAIYQEARYRPPTIAQVKAQFTRNQAAVPELAKLAEAEGRLVAISGEFFLESSWEQQLREMLTEKFSGDANGFTVSQIREILDTSRKYAVPFCEYLDRIRFTKRKGDSRVLCSAGD